MAVHTTSLTHSLRDRTTHRLCTTTTTTTTMDQVTISWPMCRCGGEDDDVDGYGENRVLKNRRLDIVWLI